MQLHRRGYIVGILVGLAAAGTALGLCSRGMGSSLPGQLLRRMELATYDFRIAHCAPNTASESVVLVTIDEESISELGTWPWPRNYHASVIDRLAKAGAAVIGLDLILSTVSNPDITEQFARNKPLDWEPPPGRNDLILEEALKSAGNVVMAASLVESRVRQGEITQAQFPYWRFEDASRALGVVNIPKDVDGTIRRFQLSRMYQDQRYFTMPTVVSSIYLQRKTEQLVRQVARSSGNPARGIHIAYRGRPGMGFKRIPYYQVLRQDMTADLRKLVGGRVVLIGATAHAIQDLHDTPLSIGMRAGRDADQSSQMPGVEVMANAIDTILSGNYVRSAGLGLTALLTCLISLPVTLLVVRLRPLPGLPGAWLPGQAMAILLSFALWQWSRLWIPLVTISLGVTLAYVFTTVYMELTTERQRRSLQQSWARRVSPEVLRVILNSPSLSRVKGRRLVATVMFTDLREFTAFCHDSEPEQVVESLNECLALVTGTICKHGGTIHKFIGDGVLAVFGDPIPQPDHARRALAAACELQQEMAELRSKVQKGRWLPYLRIGIHTGELVAGDIGSKDLLEYTVIGDTVSTASRLEALNKEYGTEIMLSGSTLEASGRGFPLRSLGSAQVRGLGKPIEVFTIDPLDYAA